MPMIIRHLCRFFASFGSLVLSSCLVVAQTCDANMTDLNFGNIDVTLNQNTDISGTLSISCSGIPDDSDDQVRICLHMCEGSGGMDSDANPRYMNNTSGLQFNAYRDSSRTSVWGASAGASTACSGWPAGTLNLAISGLRDSSGNYSTTVPVYGRVFSGQTSKPAGSYSSLFTTTSNSDSRFVMLYRNCCQNCLLTSGWTVEDAPFTASATVVASCTVSATTLAFGTQPVLTAAVNSTSTVGVTCTSGSGYFVGLDDGTTSGGTTTTRKMLGATSSATVNYAMYKDSGRSQNWGDTGSERASGTGAGSVQNFTVYGQIPNQTTPKPDTYTDTVTVTVTY